MSSFSVHFINFLILTILLAAVAVVLRVQTEYIALGAGILLAIGLVTSLGKQRSDEHHV